MASPSTNGDGGNATDDSERRRSSQNDIEMAAQPQGSLSRPDRRRPRSRITFSFLGSFTSSINSNSSAQSSILTEDVAGSRRNSFNVDLSPEMIDEDPDHVPTTRRNSLGSVDSSSDSQRSNSAGSKILRLFSSHGKEGDPEESAAALAKRTRVSTLRRYGKGDYVLISNHDLSDTSLQLVNVHGFAEWDAGEALTADEERGPFVYLLAQVKSLHFTENLPYYTVTRMDNGEEQRSDVGK